MMKKLIGNGFTNELYYFAICVIIVSAFVLGGCDSVHRTWHNIESPIHKWFDEKLDIHHDEHTVKDEPIDMGIWAEDKEIVATDGTFPKVTEK
tara:strand:- start:577 stop:855 length:279 start_codon:yes stop_codon:yes gene_type:complete